ncbi:MAG: hypothetical protein WCI27_08450 [Candidatus Omnitrophota bacterium]
MLKKIIVGICILAVVWHFWGPLPKAEWKGVPASPDPVQVGGDLPVSWMKGIYTITPRARYHIKAVVLSKHYYWAGYDEDVLAPYDLALGWGVMSEARVINALKFVHGGRWYNFMWKGDPPEPLDEMVRHASNHHILAADENVLRQIKKLRRFDLVDLEGYLVDVTKKDGWHWNSSLTRDDSGGGACELFWVKSVNPAIAPPVGNWLASV